MMRLHELAKEIGAESKLLLALAKELGLKAKNHSATLTVGEIALLKAAYREEHGPATPPPAAATPEPAAEGAGEPRKRRTRTRPGESESGEAGEAGSDAPVEDVVATAPESSSVETVAPSAPVVEAPTSATSAGAPAANAPTSAATSPAAAPAAPPSGEPVVESKPVPASPMSEATPAAKPEAHAPATQGPSTHGPSTHGPSTAGPSTPGPSTQGPSAPRPSTQGPATHAPSAPGQVRPAAQGPAGPGQVRPAAQTGHAPTGHAPNQGPGGPGRPGSSPQRPPDSSPHSPQRSTIAARSPMHPLPGGRTVRGGPVTQSPAPPRANPGDPAQPGQAPALSPIKRPSRPAGGAKILGRIELPPEEIARQKQMRTAPGPQSGGSSESSSTVRPGGRPPTAVEIAAEEAAKKRGIRDRADSGSWNPDDEDDPLLQSIRMRQAANVRRPPRRVGPRKAKKTHAPVIPTGPIEVAVPISVRDLSSLLGSKVTEMLRILLGAGRAASVNSSLNEESVLEVATALNREIKIVAKQNLEQSFMAEVDAMEKKLAASDESGRLMSRPPVVAFLGHVDHGKTSLLDYIRKTNVAAGEAGGITQSMRAYSVTSPSGNKITLLDTPGHKAFTEMRARGAKVTDIVVLVVAADDGVMPQTEEAIQHAKAAGVPIVVAMNKIDRGEANADRVLQQLAALGVLAEDWGGDVLVARTSATTGQGMNDLLEKLTLQAEVMELRADTTRQARGVVLEARKDEQLGAIATVLVQEGTLKVGDVLLSGTTYGRIRKLIADDGSSITEALPSTPVNVIGLSDPPDASAPFFAIESMKKGREIADERLHAHNKERTQGQTRATLTLENLFASLEAGKAEEVRLLVRCDVKGSLEVVKKELESLSTKEVRLKLIRDALGGITEDDVLLAIASEATIIGFNVVADEKARQLADQRGIDIRTYEIIYQLVDDVKAAMEGKLSPLQREAVIGHVEIREIFKVSKVGTIAGGLVRDGVIKRNSKVRLTRDGRIIHTGKLSSLKRFKDDAREVKEGLECGLKLDGYDDIKPGDIVEAFEVAEEKRTLDFSAGAG